MKKENSQGEIALPHQTIAKARIHVECAIAQIKDFRILQTAFPLTLKDQLDNIFIICAVITNLAPALVPI